MSLGLYISSFYFFHSDKSGSSYLGLNRPIQHKIHNILMLWIFSRTFLRRIARLKILNQKRSYILLKPILLGVEKQRNIHILQPEYIQELMGWKVTYMMLRHVKKLAR